ncbi:MAG: hypothetical protein IJX09_00005, partial [Clostridia bacterium]|nr:hypothetical protein [Clostridia bacterium]
MKKLTKFLLGLLAVCSLSFAAIACDNGTTDNSGSSDPISGGIDSISPDDSSDTGSDETSDT